MRGRPFVWGLCPNVGIAVPSSASAAGPSTSLFQPQQHQEASPLASPVVQIQVARKKPPRKKPVTLLVEPLRTPSPPRSAFKSPVRSRKANRFQISRPPAATQPASASAPVGRPPSSRQPDTRAVLPPPGVEPSRLPLPRSISATQPVTARVAALDINGPGTSSSSHAQNILSSIDEFQRRRRRSVLPSTSSSDDLPNDASALLREIEADQAASSANASASKPIPRTADSSDDGVVVRKGGEQGMQHTSWSGALIMACIHRSADQEKKEEEKAWLCATFGSSQRGTCTSYW